MVTYGPKYFKQHLQTNSNFQVTVTLWQRDVKMRAVVHYNSRLLARRKWEFRSPPPRFSRSVTSGDAQAWTGQSDAG